MAVDRGEPEARHGIKSPQGLQDREPDVLGVDLCLAACPQRVLDLLAEPGEIILADRSTLAGLPDASDDLVASEGLDDTGTLDDDELRLLDGGEPPLAGRTLPSAPDAGPVLGNAGVEDPRVRVLAVRAEHGLSPPSLWMRLWTRCAHPVDDYLYPWDNYISVTTRCSDLASRSATSQCLRRCRGVSLPQASGNRFLTRTYTTETTTKAPNQCLLQEAGNHCRDGACRCRTTSINQPTERIPI